MSVLTRRFVRGSSVILIKSIISVASKLLKHFANVKAGRVNESLRFLPAARGECCNMTQNIANTHLHTTIGSKFKWSVLLQGWGSAADERKFQSEKLPRSFKLALSWVEDRFCGRALIDGSAIELIKYASNSCTKNK